MNSSPHIDPHLCRTCGDCCKRLDIWYAKDSHPIQLSEMQRIMMLADIGDKISIHDAGDGWWLRFNVPCRHLTQDDAGTYSCDIYDSLARPLLCQHFPYAESTTEDCPHMESVSLDEEREPVISLIGCLTKGQYRTLQGAWKQWGSDAQMDMVIEEAAELIHAILRTRRNGLLWAYAISEEIADLLICLQQVEIEMRRIPWFWYQVQKIHAAKLARLRDRLEEAREADRVAAEDREVA